MFSVNGESEAVDGNILGRTDFELSKYLFGIEVENLFSSW